jgi:hypothetical protein
MDRLYIIPVFHWSITSFHFATFFTSLDSSTVIEPLIYVYRASVCFIFNGKSKLSMVQGLDKMNFILFFFPTLVLLSGVGTTCFHHVVIKIRQLFLRPAAYLMWVQTTVNTANGLTHSLPPLKVTKYSTLELQGPTICKSGLTHSLPPLKVTKLDCYGGRPWRARHQK